MSEIKRIDASEFQQVGFLQEANRLFFHPHGLALEITTVDEDGWTPEHRWVSSGAERLVAQGWGQVAAEQFVGKVLGAVFPPGSMLISGCWDCREDPEGVIFGSWYGQDTEKAEVVAAERERHREARTALFGGDSDIEPLGYVYEESGEASP